MFSTERILEEKWWIGRKVTIATLDPVKTIDSVHHDIVIMFKRNGVVHLSNYQSMPVKKNDDSLV